jgi:hypothetical protein
MEQKMAVTLRDLAGSDAARRFSLFFDVLAVDEPTAAWGDRMIDAFAGLVRKTAAEAGER